MAMLLLFAATIISIPLPRHSAMDSDLESSLRTINNEPTHHAAAAAAAAPHASVRTGGSAVASAAKLRVLHRSLDRMRREQATLERQSDVRRDAVVKMARDAIAAERDAFVAEVEVEVMDHARDYVRREMRSLESVIRASLTSTVRARLRDHAAAAAAAAADADDSSGEMGYAAPIAAAPSAAAVGRTPTSARWYFDTRRSAQTPKEGEAYVRCVVVLHGASTSGAAVEMHRFKAALASVLKHGVVAEQIEVTRVHPGAGQARPPLTRRLNRHHLRVSDLRASSWAWRGRALRLRLRITVQRDDAQGVADLLRSSFESGQAQRALQRHHAVAAAALASPPTLEASPTLHFNAVPHRVKAAAAAAVAAPAPAPAARTGRSHEDRRD